MFALLDLKEPLPIDFSWIKLNLDCYFTNVYRNNPNNSNIREGIPVVIDNARGDGSCGYRSLAHLLCGDQEEHLKVRQILCEFIEENSIPGYKELYPEGIREATKKKELFPNISGVLDRTYWMTDADIVCAAVNKG